MYLLTYLLNMTDIYIAPKTGIQVVYTGFATQQVGGGVVVRGL